MDPKIVEQALKDVVEDIQNNSGLDCPPLSGETKPADEVPKFDSKVWIAATTLVADKLNIEIPDDQNIFVNADTKKSMNISEIARFICTISKSTSSSEDAA